MPTWGEVLRELNASAPPGRPPQYDTVRRKYLKALRDYTKRAVIIYYTAFLESRSIPPVDLQINLEDIAGFMEAASNIDERELDLIIHSPGGTAEAAESIVTYLRKRFDHIRVFVPLAAMSAATMVALSADQIVMGQHSQLGPIDPQFIVQTPEGPRFAPAKAILKQFELAKEECRNPSNLAAWMPILRSYLPGLLTQCQDSRKLAVSMVTTWLKQYMFADDQEAESKAASIAEWFGDYDSFSSHGRRVSPDEAIHKGLNVAWLEEDPQLQDAVLTVHHATMHTLTSTGSSKIVENHHGRAWVKLVIPALVQQVGQQRPPTPSPSPQQPPAGSAPSNPTPPINRAERRRIARKGR